MALAKLRHMRRLSLLLLLLSVGCFPQRRTVISGSSSAAPYEIRFGYYTQLDAQGEYRLVKPDGQFVSTNMGEPIYIDGEGQLYTHVSTDIEITVDFQIHTFGELHFLESTGGSQVLLSDAYRPVTVPSGGLVVRGDTGLLVSENGALRQASAQELLAIELEVNVDLSAYFGMNMDGWAAGLHGEIEAWAATAQAWANSVDDWAHGSASGTSTSNASSTTVDTWADPAPSNVERDGSGSASAAGSMAGATENSVELAVNIDIQFDINTGFLILGGSDAQAPFIVTPDGQLVTDASGRAIHLGDTGTPFVMDDGARIDLDMRTDMNAAWAEMAQPAVQAPSIPSQETLVAASVEAQVNVDINLNTHVGAGQDGVSSEMSVAENDDTSLDAVEEGALNVGIDAQVEPDYELAEARQAGAPATVTASTRAPSLPALLTDEGIAVDGFEVSLDDLGPVRHLAVDPPDSIITTTRTLSATVMLEHAIVARGGGETELILRVAGGDAPPGPSNVRLHLVIDKSTSMESTWPEVRAAAETLVRQLREGDSIQIVTYSTDAEEVFPLTRVGNGQAARAALHSIQVGGGTNIEAGLHLAYQSAAANVPSASERSVVFLLSDGVPNGGAFTADELGPLAAQAQAGGCSTTSIGLGTQFDPAVLRAIARAGAGHYEVARGVHELEDVLRTQLLTEQNVAARNVTVRVDLEPGVELVEGADLEGYEVNGTSVSLTLPQLLEDEVRIVRFPVSVGPGAESRVAAYASVFTADGQVAARKALMVAFGDESVLTSAMSAMAIADAELSIAMDNAANAVMNGRGEDAATFLSNYAAEVRAAGYDTYEPIANRTLAVDRLASELAEMTNDASHRARRSVAISMGDLAARLAP